MCLNNKPSQIGSPACTLLDDNRVIEKCKFQGENPERGDREVDMSTKLCPMIHVQPKGFSVFINTILSGKRCSELSLNYCLSISEQNHLTLLTYGKIS